MVRNALDVPKPRLFGYDRRAASRHRCRLGGSRTASVPPPPGRSARRWTARWRLLDSGTARVAEPVDGGWQVNQWLKKAVLLSFRLNDSVPVAGGPGGAAWFDKVRAEVPGLGRRPLPQRRLSRGARLHRPRIPLTWHQAWC